MEGKNKKMNGNNVESKLDRFWLFAGLLQRYFNGKATQKEKQLIDTWDAQSAWEKHREIVSNRKMDAACDEVWNKISSQLHFEKEPKTIKSIQLRHRYVAAAAIFVLLISFSYWGLRTDSGFRQQYLSWSVKPELILQTTSRELKTRLLPDGTKVYLNGGGRLSYKTGAFNKSQREVWLEGEAFFEVAKNKEKPFIIHTGAIITTVRGTSFNIKAYPQLAENIVSVRSGKVEVGNATQTYAVLTHNKQLTYNAANKTAQITESNWEDAAGWTKGRLVLNGGAEELRLRLRQQFGVEVNFEKNALANERLTGTFDKTSKLTDVLATIGAIYNIRYTIINNHVTIRPSSSN